MFCPDCASAWRPWFAPGRPPRYQQKIRALLKEKSFREALDLLAEALRKFPGDAGLERLSNRRKTYTGPINAPKPLPQC